MRRQIERKKRSAVEEIGGLSNPLFKQFTSYRTLWSFEIDRGYAKRVRGMVLQVKEELNNLIDFGIVDDFHRDFFTATEESFQTGNKGSQGADAGQKESDIFAGNKRKKLFRSNLHREILSYVFAPGRESMNKE